MVLLEGVVQVSLTGRLGEKQSMMLVGRLSSAQSLMPGGGSVVEGKEEVMFFAICCEVDHPAKRVSLVSTTCSRSSGGKVGVTGGGKVE